MNNNDISFQAVIDRLRLATGLEEEQAVGEALGFTRSAFSVRKSRNKLPREEIEEYCSTNKINPRWVLDGEGSMYAEPGFDERRQLQAEITEQVDRMALDPGQSSHLVKLLLSLRLGDRLRLRELLSQSERIDADDSLLLQWFRQAPPAQRDQALLLARVARYEKEHGPLPDWLRPAPPARQREPVIPPPDEARLKPAEARRLREAKARLMIGTVQGDAGQVFAAETVHNTYHKAPPRKKKSSPP